MAHGEQNQQDDVIAMEMTKWFDTNYHYIVPEFVKNQSFSLFDTKVVDEFAEALALGIKTKPVLVGPVSYLLLGKEKEEGFGRPVEAIHVDLVRCPEQLDDVLKNLPVNKQLSLGIVDGRNIWKNDIEHIAAMDADVLKKAARYIDKEKLWVNPDCGLKTRGWTETKASLIRMVEAAKEMRKE